ncbi:hypothetical protein [Parabacteroides gordonii]|uniref:hypothetical protein n=1 Tax=Parabacteroides gordonii TaxID=574930 RepID=UPI0026F3574C|nr:hypothetical protein [Parabacteroides gordonii]
MNTDVLNTNLIEVMKNKIPDGVNLANTLMDILYIGKEAVYRRLRGEVPFTLNEASIISKKMGVSLDQIVGISYTNNAMFDLNLLHYSEPIKTYYTIISHYLELFESLRYDLTSELSTASNMIPQTFYLKYDNLSKFRLFKWMYQNEKVNCVKYFSELNLSDELKQAQKDFVNATQYIQTTNYIWDSMMFVNLVNDIKYFASIHLITDEEVIKLQEELLMLLDDLENIAAKGKFNTGKNVRIYISNINFEATYSYVETSNMQLSLIRVFSINSITSRDKDMCKSMKEWVQSLRKFSTMISESGEMQRIQFFKQQREIVEKM